MVVVPLRIKEGVALIKPVAPNLSRGAIELLKDDKVYKRGVVQDYPPALFLELKGIKPGDTVYYTKPIIKTEHGVYVEIDDLLCLEQPQV